MAPIIRDLKALPDPDIRAMAVYLNSFNDTAIDTRGQDALAAKLESSTRVTVAPSTGARLYQGACAVCHEVGGLPLFGTRPSLALNSNLHSATSDNLVQVVLHGINEPVSSDLGYMPAFKNSMSDAQVEELVSFLRQQFAPDKPAWTGVRETIARVRSSVH
ncbi:mono/diheme cytochrome c family protein [Bradyrhizobium japonicum]